MINFNFQENSKLILLIPKKLISPQNLSTMEYGLKFHGLKMAMLGAVV